ncbi:cation diffusion facilitator family transporter [Pseudooceanicola sp. 502str34]|uniref:cation diffusion facilitator family transporter n=1 Tax=Maritimibacter alkaliphilus TaxID=404236 RepID=UPI001C98095B|nr:cation diffusion facilitator family transporter [Maritimibacter alkaliphilus]MBY6090782.1 cation diffusion facilitator family transporter [Maritimibacter alkaliphilus]
MPHDHGHAHGHAHGHHHHHALPEGGGDARLWAAIGVNFALTLVQIVAGILSGSLALIADAIHNLSDALSLVIAFAARRIARRPADAAMTFGYGRAEVVAALVNYVTLIVVALYLAAEGVQRLFNPVEVEGWTVVIVAGVALVIDTVTALLVFSMSKDSVNIRAAFLHNVADALGSVAVIVAGVAILVYDWRLVDPIVTLGISAYILWHAGVEIGPVIRILMLGAPDEPGAQTVLDAMRAEEGVADVHHLHLWRMQERETSLEAHVVLTAGADGAVVRQRLKTLLHETFELHHSVLELEDAGSACQNAKAIGH